MRPRHRFPCVFIVCAFAAVRLQAQALPLPDPLPDPLRDSLRALSTETVRVVDVGSVAIGSENDSTVRLSAWRGLHREFISSSTPIRVLLGASVDQWQDTPMEWHQTFIGFGQRGSVRLAEISAQLSVLYGTAALLGQDPTYRPLRHGSAWKRTQHALVGSVTAYRVDGSRVFAPGTFTGAVAAAVVSKQLLPHTTKRAEIISRGTAMLSNRVIRSLWKEFLSPPAH